MQQRAAAATPSVKALLQILEGDNFAGDSTGRDGNRTGEPDLARTGTAGEISVDRADRNRFRILRQTRAATGAGAARGLENFRANLFKGIDIALNSGSLGFPWNSKNRLLGARTSRSIFQHGLQVISSGFQNGIP